MTLCNAIHYICSVKLKAVDQSGRTIMGITYDDSEIVLIFKTVPQCSRRRVMGILCHCFFGKVRLHNRHKVFLNVSRYFILGTAGDSLIGHHGYSFSTKDQDNDSNKGNCAELFQGGWWYREDCFFSNLNGVYRQRRAKTCGVSWYTWKRNYSSLKKAEMKIRPVEF